MNSLQPFTNADHAQFADDQFDSLTPELCRLPSANVILDGKCVEVRSVHSSHCWRTPELPTNAAARLLAEHVCSAIAGGTCFSSVAIEFLGAASAC